MVGEGDGRWIGRVFKYRRGSDKDVERRGFSRILQGSISKFTKGTKSPNRQCPELLLLIFCCDDTFLGSSVCGSRLIVVGRSQYGSKLVHLRIRPRPPPRNLEPPAACARRPTPSLLS